MLATESLIIVDHDQILAVFFYIVRVKGDPFLFLLYIFIYSLNMLNITSVFKKWGQNMYNYSVYYILLGVSVTWYKAVIPNMSISGVTEGIFLSLYINCLQFRWWCSRGRSQTTYYWTEVNGAKWLKQIIYKIKNKHCLKTWVQE